VLTDLSYTEQEWADATEHRPLRALAPNELALLHRHWMWANQVREAFDATLSDPSDRVLDSPAMLASRTFGLLFVWYALLYVVVEASVDPKELRNLDIRGRFRADIDSVCGVLRQCRNAVLHVPRSGEYIDPRLESLVAQPDSAVTLRRVSIAFGRLFFDEFAHRGAHRAPDIDAPAG
jgi:hypothetical protein